MGGRGFLSRKAPKTRQRDLVATSNVLSVDGSTIATGTVGTSQLGDGQVTANKLDPSLLQGFHVECAAGLKVAPSANIAFAAASSSWGTEQWSDTSTLSLKQGGYLRIHAQIIFLGETTAVLPGARAQIVMVNHLGAVVAAGPTCVATPRIGGVVALVATLDEELVLSAGGVETYHFQYRAEAADGSAVVLWLVDNTNLAASPPVGGSFVEAMVVPRPT